MKNKWDNAICVDFDGVIAEKTEDVEIFGKVISGARESLAALKEAGCKIIIHTSRPDSFEEVEKITDYLYDSDIEFDDININSDCEWSTPKPPAALYIDDHALRFEGNWNDTLQQALYYLSISTIPGTNPEEIKEMGKELFNKFMGLFEYRRAVSLGRLVDYEYLKNDDMEFQSLYPDHPLSGNNRLARIKAADYFCDIAREMKEKTPNRITELMHKSLFDCCAAVRHPAVEALQWCGNADTIGLLLNLRDVESESEAVRSSSLDAINALEQCWLDHLIK